MDPVRVRDPKHGRKTGRANAPRRGFVLACALLLAAGLSVAAAPAVAYFFRGAEYLIDLRPMPETAHGTTIDPDELFPPPAAVNRSVSLEEPIRPDPPFAGPDEDTQSPTAVAALDLAPPRDRLTIPDDRKRDYLCVNPCDRSYDAQAPPRG